MIELGKEYGSVYTLFFGESPNIVITDPKIGLEVLKKHQFAGRPPYTLAKYHMGDGIDIIFSDFTKEWEALRKVGHLAARKFAVSPNQAKIVNQAIDYLIDQVGEEPFESEANLSKTMISILASIAYGKKFEFSDPEFLQWKSCFDFVNSKSPQIYSVEFFPPLAIVYRNIIKTYAEKCDFQASYTGKMLNRAITDFEEGKLDTFCDAIIAAKKEAEKEESTILKYLKTRNLINAINNLFEAGVETTKITTQWAFLYMAHFPELQEKIRNEVDKAMDQELPTIDHKERCPLLCAFINETLRMRPIAATGMQHTATMDTDIGGIRVRKGTTVMVNIKQALHNKEAWGDPENFRPQRFLDENNKFVSKPNSMFIPFSEGRRSCPGNKLAFNNLFIILSRFLQRTRYIDVYGGVENVDMNGDIDNTEGWCPHNYSLILSLKPDSQNK